MSERDGRRAPAFWVTAAMGWAVIGWGIRGALHHRIDTRPTQFVRWMVEGVVLHDAVFAPVVLVGGVVIARTVGGRWRAPIQAALFISGVVALFTYPEVRDFASSQHNPSSLPHNYAANLVIVVGAVWIGAALVACATWWRDRSRAVRPGGD